MREDDGLSDARAVAAVRTPGGAVQVTLLDYLDLTTGRSLASKRSLAFESAACAADSGYDRLWVAEHHGRAAPCGSPLAVCAALGSAIRNIRLGTAVTLLRIRDTYLTALDIHQASHFCESGFDVGLGRGDVRGDAEAAVAHLRKDDDRLNADIAALAALLKDGNKALAPLEPGYQMWLHGSGSASAEVAGKLGFNYCHALFLNPDIELCRAAYERYRAFGHRGTTSVAVAFACGGEAMLEREVRQRWGVLVNLLGSAEECARVALRARAVSGADEIVIAELSEDREQHLRMVQEIRSAIAEMAN